MRRFTLAGIGALCLGLVLWLWPGRQVPPETGISLPPLERSAGPLRLAVLGTSLTAYYDWPHDVARHLEACTARPVVLTVLARGGASSAWARTRIPDLAVAAPDILLIEFSINDADLRNAVGLRQSRSNHAALVAAARRANPDVRIVLLRLNRAWGLRRLLRPRLPAYEALYDRLAAELGTGLLPLGAAWDRAVARAGRRNLVPDGVHPDAQAVARITVPRLQNALATLVGCAGTGTGAAEHPARRNGRAQGGTRGTDEDAGPRPTGLRTA